MQPPWKQETLRPVTAPRAPAAASPVPPLPSPSSLCSPLVLWQFLSLTANRAPRVRARRRVSPHRLPHRAPIPPRSRSRRPRHLPVQRAAKHLLPTPATPVRPTAATARPIRRVRVLRIARPNRSNTFTKPLEYRKAGIAFRYFLSKWPYAHCLISDQKRHVASPKKSAPKPRSIPTSRSTPEWRSSTFW